MAEYIEREKAFKLIKEQKEKETGAYTIGKNKGLAIAGSIINNKEALPTADVPDINDISTKIANALIKAEIDCTSICKDFGGGCYWNCEDKVEHIKQWVLGVIENDT